MGFRSRDLHLFWHTAHRRNRHGRGRHLQVCDRVGDGMRPNFQKENWRFQWSPKTSLESHGRHQGCTRWGVSKYDCAFEIWTSLKSASESQCSTVTRKIWWWRLVFSLRKSCVDPTWMEISYVDSISQPSAGKCRRQKLSPKIGDSPDSALD